MAIRQVRRPSSAIRSAYGGGTLQSDQQYDGATIDYNRPEYEPKKTLSDVFDFQTPFVDKVYDPGPAIFPPSEQKPRAGYTTNPTPFLFENPLIGEPVDTGAIGTALQDYLTNLYQDVEGDPAYKAVQRQLDDYALSRKRYEEDAAKDLAALRRQREDFKFNYGYDLESLVLAEERGRANYADQIAGMEAEYEQMQRDARRRIEALLDMRAGKEQLDKNLEDYSAITTQFSKEALEAAKSTEINSARPLIDARASNEEAVLAEIAAITGGGNRNAEDLALQDVVRGQQGDLDGVMETLTSGELANRVAQRNASVTAVEAEDAIRLFMEDLRNKELDAGFNAADEAGIEGITQAGEGLGFAERARDTADRQFEEFLTDQGREKELLDRSFKRQLEEWTFSYDDISDGLKRQLEDLGIAEAYLNGDFEEAQAAAMKARTDGMTSHNFALDTVFEAFAFLNPDLREPQLVALQEKFETLQGQFQLYELSDWTEFLKTADGQEFAGADAGLLLKAASEYDNAYDTFDAFLAGPQKSDATTGSAGRYDFDPATLQSKYHPSGYTGQNGQLPASELVSIGSGHQLSKPAGSAYLSMIEAAAKDGITFGITDSYRTYQTQVSLADSKGLYSKGGLAAYPGTSEHGEGNALDLYRGGGGKMTSSSPEYKWLVKNGAKYGFKTIDREPWHWEYTGGFTATTGGGDRSLVSGDAPADLTPPSTSTRTNTSVSVQ